MESKETEKTPIVVSKSFMTFGPTLHYSHKNVQRYWLLTILVYGISCLFWSKMSTGSFWSFEIEAVTTQEFWRLDQSLITGISIFEYPWQILVLGLLMGILAITPVLISQLMSFEYCLPFILEIVILANLPGFAICIFISCFAVACRPLRFRSRFISIVLCIAPQLIYWGYFGGARGVEPIEWGFSFAPWICAWLDSLMIAGLVLGIGHFTRYRPGLVWIFTSLTLVIAVIVFEFAIGFDELDYQLYVAKNNPELANEFHDHSIAEALDKTINDPAIQKYLQGFFYTIDPIARRVELKRQIQIQLSYDRWPTWFIVPQELDYEVKRKQLLEQYELFIKKRPNSHRMPIALYFKAALSEYNLDIRMLGEQEILHFYSDYPHDRSAAIWWTLYRDFGNSPESIEARWRIAQHWASRGLFDQADKLLTEAQTMASKQIELLEAQQKLDESLFGLFQIPPESVMTISKLKELQRKLDQLRTLIGTENRNNEPQANKHLTRFVMLNPHTLEYPQQLDILLGQVEDDDPLYDNIMLAKIKLINNEQLRMKHLTELYQKYQERDGGIQALYELGLLRISQWRQQDDSDPELKSKYLDDAVATLTSFINLYPDNPYTEQVKKNLDSLPAN
jgi:ribosomal protein L17